MVWRTTGRGHADGRARATTRRLADDACRRPPRGRLRRPRRRGHGGGRLLHRRRARRESAAGGRGRLPRNGNVLPRPRGRPRAVGPVRRPVGRRRVGKAAPRGRAARPGPSSAAGAGARPPTSAWAERASAAVSPAPSAATASSPRGRRRSPSPGRAHEPAKKRSGEETFGRLMLAIAAVHPRGTARRHRCSRGWRSRGSWARSSPGSCSGRRCSAPSGPEAKDYLFPPDIVAAARRRRADRPRVLPLPRRHGARSRRCSASGSGRRPSSRTRALRSRWRSASSPRCPSTSCSHPTSTTCRSRSSSASRCRSRRSPCSPGSSPSGGCSSARSERLAMAGAAIDDVTAWGLLALATAVAGSRQRPPRAPGRRARGAVHGRR